MIGKIFPNLIQGRRSPNMIAEFELVVGPDCRDIVIALLVL
jgi:hypothetical protein